MGRLEERDLRSLERESMYSIFAPLEDDRAISRDLRHEDDVMPMRAGQLWQWGFLRRVRRRRRNGSEHWVPAMFMFVRRFG